MKKVNIYGTVANLILYLLKMTCQKYFNKKTSFLTQALVRQNKNVIKMGNLVVIWDVFVGVSIIMVLYFVLVVGFCGEALIAAAMDQRWDLAVKPALEEWTISCCVSLFMCVFVCVRVRPCTCEDSCTLTGFEPKLLESDNRESGTLQSQASCT